MEQLQWCIRIFDGENRIVFRKEEDGKHLMRSDNSCSWAQDLCKSSEAIADYLLGDELQYSKVETKSRDNTMDAAFVPIRSVQWKPGF